VRDHPPFGAPLKEWEEWIDSDAPLYGNPDPGIPTQLQSLTRNPLRDVAAIAAENWFRMRERDRQRRNYRARGQQVSLFETITVSES
jgi:hypothetical protein